MIGSSHTCTYVLQNILDHDRLCGEFNPLAINQFNQLEIKEINILYWYNLFIHMKLYTVIR